jgi:hypothetical protein
MWNELFKKLNNSEQEEFRRLLNYLLSRTFLVRDIYDAKEAMMKINPDYRFVERNFDLFMDYLSFSGWTLLKDSNYGVIALENAYEYNRVRLNRTTTLILYLLRLIFEEEREKVTLRHEVVTTTGQIVHKMITLGLVKKKPADRELIDALRQLSRHNLLEKLEGAWEEAETKLLILPSILFVITNEKISRMYETFAVEEENAEEIEDAEDIRATEERDESDEAEETEEILRGDV